MSIHGDMSEDAKVQYKMLLPAPLKEALEEHAHENKRSLSQEIISRLQASIDGGDGSPNADLLADLREERARLEKLLAEYVFLFRTDVGGSPEKVREQFEHIQRSRAEARAFKPSDDNGDDH